MLFWAILRVEEKKPWFFTWAVFQEMIWIFKTCKMLEHPVRNKRRKHGKTVWFLLFIIRRHEVGRMLFAQIASQNQWLSGHPMLWGILAFVGHCGQISYWTGMRHRHDTCTLAFGTMLRVGLKQVRIHWGHVTQGVAVKYRLSLTQMLKKQ